MDCINDQRVRRVSLMFGAQVGKTDGLINNTIGYYISQDPKSIIVMHASLPDLQAWAEGKLNPLLTDTEIVRDRIATPRGRDGVNNQRMKAYPGGYLYLVTAGSASNLRSKSAPVILCDEIDGYEVTEEGDPVQLLYQRAATFGDAAKLIEVSTPTLKGESAIERAFEAGDQRYFMLPCHKCRHPQRLVWAQVIWDKIGTGPDRHQPQTAHYECEKCKARWTDGHKLAALRLGEWKATRPFRGHASFHLAELYSPFRSWSAIVQSFLDKKAAHNIQSFVNLSLAETFEIKGDEVDPHPLKLRREPYVKVPDGVLVLVAGIDVQDDRLEVEIVGIGQGTESWGIARTVFYGDPGRTELWEQLDRALCEGFEREKGGMLHVVAAGIDTGGHYTNQAYAFCRVRRAYRCYALKGIGGAGKPIVGRPSKTNKGRVLLFPVGADTAKEQLLLSWLRVSQPGPGYCHFPAHYDDEFFAQLTAEKQVVKFKKGFPRREWIKTRPRNEALDCRLYAIAALMILNPNLDIMRSRLSTSSRVITPPPTGQEGAAQPNGSFQSASDFWNNRPF